jgi:hypothetical protein
VKIVTTTWGPQLSAERVKEMFLACFWESRPEDHKIDRNSVEVSKGSDGWVVRARWEGADPTLGPCVYEMVEYGHFCLNVMATCRKVKK